MQGYQYLTFSNLNQGPVFVTVSHFLVAITYTPAYYATRIIMGNGEF